MIKHLVILLISVLIVSITFNIYQYSKFRQTPNTEQATAEKDITIMMLKSRLDEWQIYTQKLEPYAPKQAVIPDSMKWF